MPLIDVVSIAKAKRFKLTLGQGHSLHVTTVRNTTHEFNGFSEREACLKTICKACDKAHGKIPTVIDKVSS